MLPIMLEEFVGTILDFNEVEARVFLVLMAGSVLLFVGLLVWRCLRPRIIARYNRP